MHDPSTRGSQLYKHKYSTRGSQLYKGKYKYKQTQYFGLHLEQLHNLTTNKHRSQPVSVWFVGPRGGLYPIRGLTVVRREPAHGECMPASVKI